MPRRKTLAVFLQYHQTRVSTARTRDVTADWRAKTAAEKSAWLDAYDHAQAASRVVEGVIGDAERLAQAVDDVLAENIIDAEDWNALHDLLGEAVRLWRPLEDAQSRKRDAWTAFRTLELAQPRPTAASLTYAAAQVNDAETGRAACVVRLSGFRDIGRGGPPVPRDANDVERIPWQWVAPEWEDIEFLRARDVQKAWNPDAVGLLTPGPDVWSSVADVSGGMGTSTIWVSVDAANQITDRVFRKDVIMTEAEWINPKRWDGDVRDPDNKWPNEIACHYAMKPFPHVAGLREEQHKGLLFEDACRYRLYLRYAPHGDLEQLRARYVVLDTEIPEPMIWNVVEGLAQCGQAMALGAGEGDWSEIVHRDLKPANILLDCNGTEYPDYPTPAVTDFGLAFKTPNPDPTNPRWYNHSAGTPKFMAPEQQRWVERNTLRPLDEHELREHTNVFGIGCILYCLITREPRPPETFWIGRGSKDKTLRPPPYTKVYSAALRTLIWRCLQFDIAERPSFADILAQVDDQVALSAPLRDMRNSTASPETSLENAVSEQADKYKIGSVLP